MRIGVYFCNCGTHISEKINADSVRGKILHFHDDLIFQPVDFMCSEEGKEFIESDIKKNNIDRVVIAACSPREHEQTFMRVLSNAGVNPYLMQMVNIREQVAWVTEEKTEATIKAARLLKDFPWLNRKRHLLSIRDPSGSTVLRAKWNVPKKPIERWK